MVNCVGPVLRSGQLVAKGLLSFCLIAQQPIQQGPNQRQWSAAACPHPLLQQGMGHDGSFSHSSPILLWLSVLAVHHFSFFRGSRLVGAACCSCLGVLTG